MPNTKEVEPMKIGIVTMEFDIPEDQINNEVITIDDGGSLMLQLLKVDTGYKISNAMNGWGNNCFDEYKDAKVVALSPLEQSEKKEEWVSVEKYNQLKDSFEELLSATVKMLYSGNHDKSAEITKNVWREKAGLPSPPVNTN